MGWQEKTWMELKQGDRFEMIHSSMRIFSTLALLLSLIVPCAAQQSPRKPAYDLLPDSSQAVVWIRDGELLSRQWERTQLYDLAHDPAIAPFFEEQRQEIETKLVDAGWRLNVKPEDLADYSTGQIALAWLELPAVPRKPYATVLLADVDDAKIPNDKLLGKIDQELKQRKATLTQLSHQGVAISKYTLPKRPDALISEDSYYAITKGQFVATDDEALMKEIASRIQGEKIAGGVLAQDKVFISGRAKGEVSGEGHVEYFVRPLGMARVLRSIGGKRSKSNADMLAVLKNQGFDAIECVCGELSVGLEELDISHHGYVLATMPLPKSAAMLDFPNRVRQEIPSFVGKNVSSLLATYWNAQEAFWKVEGLVDEMAGQAGVFREVIEGIKLDANGPRIDIEKEVLPHITNDIYSLSDSKEGAADVDSRRNLIALRLNNSAAMAKVLDRAMENEPDAELVEFNGNSIWKVVHHDDEQVTDLAADFGGDFGAPPAQASGDPEPWLSNWAIAVNGEYLMFASHAEMIQDAIQQASLASDSPLTSEPDYQRVTAAIARQFGEAEGSAWQVIRTSLAYRVQYELFREGKLMQSQSMLASILDRLLQKEDEMRIKEQKLSGSKLPPYEQIAHFLQPSGLKVRTTDSGWEFGSLMLAGSGAAGKLNQSDLNAQAGQGTARARELETEANR